MVGGNGDYQAFLARKQQLGGMAGFEPLWIPDWLFDVQKYFVEWSIRKGRAAIWARAGMGKTPMQLVWAANVAQHTNGRVLVIAPLAVSHQTEREAEKFSIEAKRSADGKPAPHITITNYERLQHFHPGDYIGVVCDEPILKNFSGAIRKRLTRFMSKIPYRLLCTATPAPNDYVELGTESEALGELSYSDMLRRFFQQLDDKGQKKETRLQDQAEAVIASDPNYFKKLAYRVAQTIGQWRLKHHAVIPFWRWVTSWAMACRMPSDLGFDDGKFILPELREHEHEIPSKPAPGMLFSKPAFGMAEERAERRRMLTERCEYVARLVDHNRPVVVWCQENPEADRLEEIIPGAEQIAGRTPDGRKLELYEAFASGQLRCLVTKPKIACYGLNWQHCHDTVTFPSHSWEQYQQLIWRFHRFGQSQPVDVHIVATEGELRVVGNLKRKGERAEKMLDAMIREMNHATRVEREDIYTKSMEVPAWV